MPISGSDGYSYYSPTHEKIRPNHFKISGTLKLSVSKVTVKVYSDRHGFIGIALRNEIADLFQGKLAYVNIVVYDSEALGEAQP